MSRPPKYATTSSISAGAPLVSAWSDRKAATFAPVPLTSSTTACACFSELT
jgi:hypothetical protein